MIMSLHFFNLLILEARVELQNEIIFWFKWKLWNLLLWFTDLYHTLSYDNLLAVTCSAQKMLRVNVAEFCFLQKYGFRQNLVKTQQCRLRWRRYLLHMRENPTRLGMCRLGMSTSYTAFDDLEFVEDHLLCLLFA